MAVEVLPAVERHLFQAEGSAGPVSLAPVEDAGALGEEQAAP